MKRDIESTIAKTTEEKLADKRQRNKWTVIISALAVVTAIGVGFGLRYIGQALNHIAIDYECEIEGLHEHTDECYKVDEDGEYILDDKGEKILICGIADYPEHKHNRYCYDKFGDLTCKLEEKSHKHTDECYKTEKELVCELDELTEKEAKAMNKAVADGKDPYQVLEDMRAGKAEATPEATKTPETTKAPEATPEATPTPEVTEQAGAETTPEATPEEEEPAVVSEDSDDEAVEIADEEAPTATEFVEHKHTNDCYKYTKVLVCGELETQVKHDHTENCIHERELTDAEKAKLNKAKKKLDPDKEYSKEYKDDKYVVTVTYMGTAEIPEEAELRVEEVKTPKEVTENEELLEEIKESVAENDDELNADDIDVEIADTISLDIGFYLDGEEIEPKTEVKVSVEFCEKSAEEVGEMTIIHSKEEGEVEILDSAPAEGEGKVEFEANSFSIYTFATTNKRITNPAAGIYKYNSTNFELRYNDTENAFLTDAYAKYRIANGTLGQVASNFHIVAFDTVESGTHINGNILAKNGNITTNNWGTNCKNGVGVTELSYIQNLKTSNMIGAIPDMGATNKEPHAVVIGDKIKWETYKENQNNRLKIGNQDITFNSDSALLYVKDYNSSEAPFINFATVEAEVREVSASLYNYSDSNVSTHLVKTNTEAYRFIRLENADYAGYVTIKAEELAGDSIMMLGFDKTKHGSLVVNVDCSNIARGGTVEFASGAPIYYSKNPTNPGQPEGTNETVDFSGGRVIWNFVNSDGITIKNLQNLTGAIIAPGADLYVSNMNGNIIGKNVHITGETHRTDFTGIVIPFNAAFSGVKTVNGQPAGVGESFTFILSKRSYDNNNGKWDEIERTVSKPGSGRIDFAGETYKRSDANKTYYYMIEEAEDANMPNYVFDKHVYVIKVVVEQTGERMAAKSTVFRFDNKDAVRFNNSGQLIYSDSNICQKANEYTVDNTDFNNTTLREFYVEKKWVGIDGSPLSGDDTDIPGTIEVELRRYTINADGNRVNDEAVKEKGHITLSRNNSWKGSWSGLKPTDDSGSTYYYYALELTVLEKFEQVQDNSVREGKTEDTAYIITNKKKPSTTSLWIEKEFFVANKENATDFDKDFAKVSNPYVGDETEGSVTVKVVRATAPVDSENWSKWQEYSVPVGTTYQINTGTVQTVTANQSEYVIPIDMGKTRWYMEFQGLPAYEITSGGKVLKCKYSAREMNCTLAAFPYSAGTDDAGAMVVDDTTNPAYWQWDCPEGFKAYIKNKCVATTELDVFKKWLTFASTPDTMDKTKNADVFIRFKLYRYGATESDKGEIGTYELKADSIVENPVDSGYKVDGYEIKATPKGSPDLWAANISNLPRYYVNGEGKLAEWNYSVAEVVDNDGYGYQGYKLVSEEGNKTDGKLVWTITNQSTESYALPETGGRGTLIYRIKRWFSQLRF